MSNKQEIKLELSKDTVEYLLQGIADLKAFYSSSLLKHKEHLQVLFSDLEEYLQEAFKNFTTSYPKWGE